MDHSELGPNFGKFRFKFIEPQEHPAVLEALSKYLYDCMEPMGYVKEGEEDCEKFFGAMLRRGDNLSYMAVDTETGEIAACRMVDLATKARKDEPLGFKHKCNIDSFKVCEDVCKDIDLFSQFQVFAYPDMFGLCTADKYRKQGLATEMYTRGLNFLKKRGYKVVKCGFVSPFTRRAGYKHGYRELARIKYLDSKDEDGNILNPKADPEGFMCFGIFDLTD